MESKIIKYTIHMWIIGFLIQILLHKHKVEQTEVISRLLFTFINPTLQEHLVRTFTVSQCTFICFNYDVTIQSHLEGIQSTQLMCSLCSI